MLAWDIAIRGEHGGARNPTGRNQHSTDGEQEVNIDNVNVDLTADAPPAGADADAPIIPHGTVRPSGNTVSQGLRRLERAAKSGDHAAADLLRRVVDPDSTMTNPRYPGRTLRHTGDLRVRNAVCLSFPIVKPKRYTGTGNLRVTYGGGGRDHARGWGVRLGRAPPHPARSPGSPARDIRVRHPGMASRNSPRLSRAMCVYGIVSRIVEFD